MNLPLSGHGSLAARIAAGVTSVLALTMVSAAPVDASLGGGGGCRTAVANKTVVGAAAGNGSDGSYTASGELVGRGCISRISATSVRVGLSWHGIGPINEGSMVVALYDCTTKRFVGKILRLNYTDGSKGAKSGSKPSVTWRVTSGHKYKIRLDGMGHYRRYVNGGWSATAGHYYPSHADGPTPKWVGWSTCG